MAVTEYKIETLDTCPNCGAANPSAWTSSADILLRNDDFEFAYSKCRSCNIYFQQTRPTEETIGHFYRGDYGPYSRAEKSKPPFSKLHKRLLKLSRMLTGETAAAKSIKSIFSHHLGAPDSTLFDFGCGAGKLLDDQKHKFGCQTIGMDFNESLVEAAGKRGHRAYPASVEGWTNIADDSVDLIVMNHVLEHLYRPRDVFLQMFRVLKTNGALLISTPNPAGFSAQTYLSDWFALDSPRHIMLYPPATAEALLADCGFQDIRVIALPVTKDIVRSKARREGRASPWPLNADGIQAIKTAFLARREAAAGRFDQFTLLAHKPAGERKNP
ncbi:methyltransferase family protein [Roseibium hamelinense]|uniref:Methyltransferase family protein n=1 Tax=Roseibium hamelinense TaxID=150831 RepID=A0A562T7B2_9HYPH|nr:class I SAM-dependent methyltransferase [Roseibium hamelinense]MTI42823.1 SAM-dependent methyltransferase [Roseibium hamelinense]TWI89489.1 methyltransferase family protein [Roseibium hamelinense]